jgi:hypothetical protein
VWRSFTGFSVDYCTDVERFTASDDFGYVGELVTEVVRLRAGRPKSHDFGYVGELVAEVVRLRAGRPKSHDFGYVGELVAEVVRLRSSNS